MVPSLSGTSPEVLHLPSPDCAPNTQEKVGGRRRHSDLDINPRSHFVTSSFPQLTFYHPLSLLHLSQAVLIEGGGWGWGTVGEGHVLL